MNTLNQKATERRRCRIGKCEYLLNDEAKTAWIVKGPRIGRRKRFRIPDFVIVDEICYTIESVEIGAFKKAKCLKYLVIPDSIVYIDENIFSSLPSLKSIYIGKGLEDISSWTFRDNKKLRCFTINKDNSFLKIENGVVYSKDGKHVFTTPFRPKHLQIRDSVETIEDVAFWYNPNLETVSFPSSLKIIGDNSFSGCVNLKSVNLPDGFQRCTIQSFNGCKNLEYAEFPENAEIGVDTFRDCPNVKIKFRKNITAITEIR